MTEKERKQVLLKVIERLELAYPNKQFSDEQIVEWFNHTGHLDMPAAMATVDAAIQNFKWCPSISEFLELSRSVRRHQMDSTRATTTPLSAHVLELQRKGLATQRALAESRQARGLAHDHTTGWTSCPICAQAEAELEEDSCATCFMLDGEGIPPVHFAH